MGQRLEKAFFENSASGQRRGRGAFTLGRGLTTILEGLTMPMKVLSNSDIALLQELQRCERELEYARGENRISLIVYGKGLQDMVNERGIILQGVMV